MSERDTHARAVDEGRVDLLRVLGARVLGEYLTAAFGAQSTVPDYTEHEWLKPLPEDDAEAANGRHVGRRRGRVSERDLRIQLALARDGEMFGPPRIETQARVPGGDWARVEWADLGEDERARLVRLKRAYDRGML